MEAPCRGIINSIIIIPTMIGLCIAGNTAAEEVEEAPQFGFDGLPVFRTSAIIDWGWNCFATGGNKDSQSQ